MTPQEYYRLIGPTELAGPPDNFIRLHAKRIGVYEFDLMGRVLECRRYVSEAKRGKHSKLFDKTAGPES